MSMETDLHALLATMCPRVFPLTAAALTQVPYVIYQQIGGQVINPMDNSAPGLRNARMLIRSWSKQRAEASTLSDNIEDAMRTATAFKARPDAAKFADYDEDLKLYSYEQEFNVWY